MVAVDNAELAELAELAHALRSALAVVTGTASILRESPHADVAASAGRMLAELGRANRILDNHVAAARMARGLAGQPDWLPVVDLVGAAVRRLDLAGDDPRVVCTAPDDVLVHVDPARAELLLANLIDVVVQQARRRDLVLELSAGRDDGAAWIELGDGGSGVIASLPQSSVLAACDRLAREPGGALVRVQRAGGGDALRWSLPAAAMSGPGAGEA